MSLNRAQQYNILTQDFMKQIEEYVIHYDRNSTLKSAVLRAFDSKIFSLGTDFKRLEHSIAVGNFEGLSEYLKSLIHFAEFMAGINFPLLVNTTGLLTNSAAAIFTSLPFVYCQGATRLQFNEAGFQSSLLGGTSFALSRLPSGLGAFLALTGKQISGEDLQKLGFVKEFALLDKQNLEYIKNYSARNFEVMDFQRDYRPLFGIKLNQKADVNLSIKEFFERSKTENGRKVLFDLFYRRKLIEKANFSLKENMRDPTSWLSHNQEIFGLCENFINCFEQDVLMGLPYILKPSPSVFDEKFMQFVSRIFVYPTLKEVYEALEKEDSIVARTIKAELEQKNQVILSLILKMISEARNKSFNECLATEYETALALAKHPLTKHFAFKNLFKEGEQILPNSTSEDLRSKFGFNASNPFFVLTNSQEENDKTLTLAEKVSSELVANSSIEPSHLGLTASALLPTKNYYQNLPEAFRCFFNNQTLRNPVLAKNYKEVVKTFLLRFGIDHLNPTFDKNFTLERIRLYFDWQRKIEEKSKRVFELAKDPAKLKRYISEREAAILEFTTSLAFEQTLDELINQVFADEISANEAHAQFRASEAQLLLKLPLVQKLKDHIITNRLTEDFNDKSFKELLRNLPLEIRQNRFELSEKTKKDLKIAEFKEKYKLESKLSTPADIKDALEYGVENFEEFFELKIASNEGVYLDSSKILEKKQSELTKKLMFNPKRSKFLALCLYLFDTPKTERLYRSRFVKRTLGRIKQSGLVLSKEQKLDVIRFINERFFIDYKEKSVLHDVLLLSNDKFLDFCAEIKPSYLTIKIDEYPQHRASGFSPVPISPEILQKQKKGLEEIGRMISMDLSNADEQENQSPFISSSREDLKKLIFETNFFSDGQKLFFETLEKIKINGAKFEKAFEVLHEIYALKFMELFEKEEIKLIDFDLNCVSRISFLFNRNALKEARDEFLNFIGPHLFYNFSEYLLENLDEIFTKLNKDLYLMSQENIKGFEPLQKTFSELGFEVKSEQKMQDLLVYLDDLLGFAVDLNDQFRSKVFFKEDRLKVLTQKGKEILKIKLILAKEFGLGRLDLNKWKMTIDEMAKLKEKESKLERAASQQPISKNKNKRRISRRMKTHIKRKKAASLLKLQNKNENSQENATAADFKNQGGRIISKGFAKLKAKKNLQKRRLRNYRRKVIKHYPYKKNFVTYNWLSQRVRNLKGFIEEQPKTKPVFQFAYMPHEIDFENFQTFEQLFNDFYKHLNAEIYQKGFEPKNPFTFNLKEKIGLRATQANLFSRDEAHDQHLRFDIFITNFQRKSLKQAKILSQINEYVENSRFERILLQVSAAKSSLTNQIYGTQAGFDFDSQHRASFLQAYYDAHKIEDQSSFSLAEKKPLHIPELEQPRKFPSQDSSAMRHENFSAINDAQKNLLPGIFPAVLELEKAGKQLSHGGTPSGFEDFYYALSKETVEIPSAFNEMDYRQSGRDWVELQLYTYIQVLFALRKQVEYKQSNLQLKFTDFDFLAFLSPEKIQSHLRDKLYQEVLVIENHGFTQEEFNEGAEARMNNLMRTSPELLDPQRVLKDEERLKQYIAFEAFAFKDRNQSETEILRDLRYMAKLGNSIGTKKDDDKKIAAIKQKPEQIPSDKISFDLDPAYVEIFKALDEHRESKTETLKKELSESIHSISERLSLYK